VVSGLPEAAAAVEAFCETVARRCQLVDGSRFRRSSGLWLLDEAIEISNPWPRAFCFHKSFYALAGGADLPGRIAAWLDAPGEEHVVNLFCDAPEARAEAWAAHGYALSWPFDLFARRVSPAGDAPPLPEGFQVRWVDGEALVAAVNAQQPDVPSSPATLAADDARELVVLAGDTPVAKGEILRRGDFVHVLGMWTAPGERRRGVGRRVMHELLAEAGRLGATWAVLNASLEAVRFDFYPRLGFRPAIRCARLIPAR